MKWRCAPRVIITGALLACVAVPLAYILTFGYIPSSNEQSWANFGTYFGGVTGPILSFAAFCALIYTVFLQARQLRLSQGQFVAQLKESQRQFNDQLRNSVEQFEKTSESLTRQQEYLDRQQFDSVLFQLLALQRQRLTAFIIRRGDFNDTGEIAINSIWDELLKKLNNSDFFDAMRWYQDSGKSFAEWYKTDANKIMDYLKSSFGVLDYVCRSAPSDEARTFGFEVFKRQILGAEYFLIFFASCFVKRFAWFAEEALKYGFFDELGESWEYDMEGLCSIRVSDPNYHKVLLNDSLNPDYAGAKQ